MNEDHAAQMNEATEDGMEPADWVDLVTTIAARISYKLMQEHVSITNERVEILEGQLKSIEECYLTLLASVTSKEDPSPEGGWLDAAADEDQNG